MTRLIQLLVCNIVAAVTVVTLTGCQESVENRETKLRAALRDQGKEFENGALVKGIHDFHFGPDYTERYEDSIDANGKTKYRFKPVYTEDGKLISPWPLLEPFIEKFNAAKKQGKTLTPEQIEEIMKSEPEFILLLDPYSNNIDQAKVKSYMDNPEKFKQKKNKLDPESAQNMVRVMKTVGVTQLEANLVFGVDRLNNPNIDLATETVNLKNVNADNKNWDHAMQLIRKHLANKDIGKTPRSGKTQPGKIG